MVTTLYNADTNIYYIHYSDTVLLDEVLNTIETIGNDHTLPRELKILEDSSSKNVLITFTDLEKVVDKINEALGHFSYVKHAIIDAKPIVIAFTTLVDLKLDKSKFTICNFSTREAAIKWLTEN